MSTLGLICGSCCSFIRFSPSDGGPPIFQAGPPELAPSEGAIAFPMREPEYRKFTRSGLPNLSRIQKAPVGTSADTLYGYNFVVGVSVAPSEGAIMAAPYAAKAPRVDGARDASTGSEVFLM